MSITHGTYSAYSKHKCRCEECRTANTEWYRNYRSKPTGRIAQQRATARHHRVKVLSTEYLQQHHPDVYADIVVTVQAELDAIS